MAKIAELLPSVVLMDPNHAAIGGMETIIQNAKVALDKSRNSVAMGGKGKETIGEASLKEASDLISIMKQHKKGAADALKKLHAIVS